MGPTASGKTGLAVRLHDHFPCDLISVDSALVYRGMDIGTAKPDAEMLARAPHRLINLRDPAESYSAAEFRDDALREMAEITRQGRVPVLVGGTMLYFRALLEGLSELPPADEDLRRELSRRLAEEGLESLHGELRHRDPVAAARIEPTDRQRILRAHEVMALSGRTLSHMQAAHRRPGAPYRFLKLVVAPAARAELHRRIEQRFDQMLAEGFEQEMRSLFARTDLSPELPAMRAVGYRQGWGWLAGDFDRQEMRERTLAATRQLAKRQLTWLRREPGTLCYDLDEETAFEEVLHEVSVFLDRS